MSNYYQQFKKDVVKDILGLILIWLCFIGFCMWMFYIFR